MRKVVQKAEYRALFLWNMSYIFSILYEFLQRSGKRFVLLLRAFGRPFRVLAGTEELFVFIPTGQQAIDILSRVLQTVLVEHSGPPGQAHGGEAIVLGDDNISRCDPVDQCKVHAVGALVKDQCFGTLPCDAVGCIAQNFYRHTVRPAVSHRQVHHRAAVCINQNGW